ncbi:hypothetical protein B0H14DRAFT_2613014 [Mycena olivaceomarginata]|nr:hypothetical protein B0H14DRAFT_2613014 [Mycena olivaceomarginata]
MSAKNPATGGTEDEFQAALVTYTKAGNKMAAMRRLWNTAYKMGKSAGNGAVFEGRDEPVGEKKRKIEEMADMAMGMELGREAETQRWKDGGHFEDDAAETSTTTAAEFLKALQ